MSKKQFLKRHILIINKLKSKTSSFEELKQYLNIQSQFDEENYDISVRTLQRDISEIKSIYDIEIKYNRKEKVYEITESFIDYRSDRLLEASDILDTIQIAQKFSDEIIFEQRKSCGTEHIFQLIHAIKNNLEVSFYHQKYWEDFNSNKIIQPYFLKESKNRWYVIGIETNTGKIRTFGLDRISSLQISDKKFDKKTNITHTSLFQNSFGIISREEAPIKITLEVSKFQTAYLKALPLHQSQIIASENEMFAILELTIHPTYDFIMEILSMGSEIVVIEPLSLKKEIQNTLLKTLKKYK